MKRSSVLIAAAAGMIIGGITLGGVATATTGPTISGTVIANQGTGAGAGGAWKVDGSGVTQPVSGSVAVTPATPYSADCVAAVQACAASPAATAVLIKDVSIQVQVPTGDELIWCAVNTGQIDVNNGDLIASSYIPMIKEGTYGGDYYVGNSQVDIALSAGQKVGAECVASESNVGIAATFQGVVTS